MLCSAARLLEGTFSALAMKLDYEVGLTCHRRWDMYNFEADLSMMVSRPSGQVYGVQKPKYDFPRS